VIFTKIALGAGVVMVGVVIWLAVIGVGAAGEGLITVVALVLLVAGGNALGGRSSYGGRRGSRADAEPVPLGSAFPTASRETPPPEPSGGGGAPQADAGEGR
jgi:hypothetical protein